MLSVREILKTNILQVVLRHLLGVVRSVILFIANVLLSVTVKDFKSNRILKINRYLVNI